MNPNYGKGSGSLNTFDFDLGLGSGRSNKSLNDQRQKGGPSSTTTSSYSQQSKPAAAAWQYNNNKPSWTHQPSAATMSSSGVGGLNGPTSMVGDITGRSWNSTAPSSGIGIVNKNPNLFGDLVGSALGQNKTSSNVPLKNVNSNQAKVGAYSMGSMADSLPKSGAARTGGVNAGSYSSGFNNGAKSSSGGGVGVGGGKVMGGANGQRGGGGGIGTGKDPFGSLLDFGMKQGGGGGMSSGGSGKSNKPDDSFGDFQKAPKSNGVGVKASVAYDSFGSFQNAGNKTSTAFPSDVFPAGQDDLFGSSKVSSSNFDDFSMPAQTRSQSYSSSVDPLDSLFGSGGAATAASSGGQQPTEVDFGLDTEFYGSHDDGGTTTELEGLPPPPSGLSASAAKSKGLENYKQGQFSDAIKWLSWAVILFEKAGDNVAEVLSSRASCYKEVGEYKKAVADCTKVLDNDSKNVSVLVQRALLYESMEKYKLGAEDLRAVLKIDPMNRVARSTVHRLTQMAG